MPDTLRTFIAFKLPADVTAYLRDAQADLRSHGFRARWVRPPNVHLTLKFLGDVPEEDIDDIAEAMRATAAHRGPISFRAKGLGVFPGVRRPRVVWVGLSGEIDRIGDCQKALDAQLSTLGFPAEKRPFTGHLTLGRIKGKIAPERLLEAIKARSTIESTPVVADRMILFKSDLKPSGAEYTELLSVVLQS